jgi:hypothetical protein
LKINYNKCKTTKNMLFNPEVDGLDYFIQNCTFD